MRILDGNGVAIKVWMILADIIEWIKHEILTFFVFKMIIIFYDIGELANPFAFSNIWDGLVDIHKTILKIKIKRDRRVIRKL